MGNELSFTFGGGMRGGGGGLRGGGGGLGDGGGGLGDGGAAVTVGTDSTVTTRPAR